MNTVNTVNIGKILLELRKREGLSQRELADKLNLVNDADIQVSKSAISRWENGAIPSASSVALYAKSFGVDLNYLFGIKDDCSKLVTNRPSNNYILCSDYTSAGMSADPKFYATADKIQLPDEFVGKYKGRKDLEFVKTYGDSMTNVIPEGSLIGYITNNVYSQIKPGDIVLYRFSSFFDVKIYYDIGDSVLFKYNSKIEELKGKFVVYPKDENLKIIGKVVIINAFIE